jgi:hypothetical protein
MKMKVSCFKCTFSDSDDINAKLYINHLLINDDNIYEFTCPKGHKNIFINQEEKFEILFESAAFAIKDGYLRDAVLSIASSLERLYEYVIKIISMKNNLSNEIIEKTWKKISLQSERQMGAFIFLYLLEFKKIPLTLKEDMVKFRNNVIHKGTFPSYEETLIYGEEVYKVMREIILDLKNSCQELILKRLSDRTIEMSKKAKKIKKNIDGFGISTMSIPSPVSLIRSEFSNSLTEYINR